MSPLHDSELKMCTFNKHWCRFIEQSLSHVMRVQSKPNTNNVGNGQPMKDPPPRTDRTPRTKCSSVKKKKIKKKEKALRKACCVYHSSIKNTTNLNTKNYHLRHTYCQHNGTLLGPEENFLEGFFEQPTLFKSSLMLGLKWRYRSHWDGDCDVGVWVKSWFRTTIPLPRIT